MENKVRIQKVLSDQGVLSRRRAEQFIKEGRITVNGRPAQLGHPIDVRSDIVAIDGERVYFTKKKKNYYIMLHKPRGYVTTMSDDRGRRCVADLVADLPVHVYPVGRLDKDSEGLLLMTNDGGFANTLMHPGNRIGKTYRVTIRPDITEQQLVKLSTGVKLEDGYVTQPAQVHVVEKAEGRVVLLMTIYEGKNRQIRRMCEALGLEVARLKRTNIGPVKLGMLQPGEYRELTPAELSAIRGYISKASNRRVNEEGEKAAAERREQEKSRRTASRPAKPAARMEKKAAAPAGRKPLGRR